MPELPFAVPPNPSAADDHHVKPTHLNAPVRPRDAASNAPVADLHPLATNPWREPKGGFSLTNLDAFKLPHGATLARLLFFTSALFFSVSLVVVEWPSDFDILSPFDPKTQIVSCASTTPSNGYQRPMHRHYAEPQVHPILIHL